MNIAEGSAKTSDKDFVRFLEMSLGTANELETALIIAFNIKYIVEEELTDFQNKITELRKMIYKFKESLDKK